MRLRKDKVRISSSITNYLKVILPMVVGWIFSNKGKRASQTLFPNRLTNAMVSTVSWSARQTVLCISSQIRCLSYNIFNAMLDIFSPCTQKSPLKYYRTVRKTKKKMYWQPL